MTTIKATCPSCGDVDLTPEDVRVTVARQMGWSTYTFTCPTCRESVSRPADDDVVQLLTGAGVRIEHLRIPQEYLESLALSYTNNALTQDDVLDFALWLERADDVVGEIARSRQ